LTRTQDRQTAHLTRTQDRQAGPTEWNAVADSAWPQLIQDFFQSEEGRQLEEFVREQRAQHIVYPPEDCVLRALQLTPLDQVRVVLLGQDPYHGPGQAHGLAFSVSQTVAAPPSLKNIFRELRDDLGGPLRVDTDLSEWAEQGVLLLNTTLTVRQGQAGSHRGRGWEILTNRVIESVNASPQPTVFLLWGQDAGKMRGRIDAQRHQVLAAPHPSPLSAYRGFFGSRPFSRCNQFLQANGRSPIKW